MLEDLTLTHKSCSPVSDSPPMISLSSSESDLDFQVVNMSIDLQSSSSDSSTSSPATLNPSSEDETYFFDLLHFQVENIRFKVPSIQFVRSKCLNTMACITHYDSEKDCDIIELTGITSKDFRAFLKAFYPLDYFGFNAQLTEEEWVSVLHLSSSWGIVDLRSAAISALLSPDISPLARVRVGRDLQAPRLLSSGTLALVERTQSLTFRDVETIGLEASLRVLTARELCLRRHQDPFQPLPFNHAISVASRGCAKQTSQDALVAQSVATEFNDILSSGQSPEIDDVALLCLARQCNVNAWITDAYQTLVKREHFLTLAEAQRLSVRDVVGLGRAREACLKPMDGQVICNAINYDDILAEASKAMLGIYEPTTCQCNSPGKRKMMRRGVWGSQAEKSCTF